MIFTSSLRRRRRKELGRSEIATTSRFYAKWIDTDHQQPEALGPTEVYADFLAKLGKSHHGPTTDEYDDVQDIEKLVESQELEWHAGRDSNPRPSGSKPDSPGSKKHRKPRTSDT